MLKKEKVLVRIQPHRLVLGGDVRASHPLGGDVQASHYSKIKSFEEGLDLLTIEKLTDLFIRQLAYKTRKQDD